MLALKWLRQEDWQFEVSPGYIISLFINKHSHKFRLIHYHYSFLNQQIVRVKVLWRGTRIWILGFCHSVCKIFTLCFFLPVKLHISYLITCNFISKAMVDSVDMAQAGNRVKSYLHIQSFIIQIFFEILQHARGSARASGYYNEQKRFYFILLFF